MARGRVVLAGDLDILRRDDRFVVRFAAGEKVQEIARRHGFVAMDSEPGADWADFHLHIEDADQLSNALHAALGEGLRVREVRSAIRDLEQVMAEAVKSDAGSDGS